MTAVFDTGQIPKADCVEAVRSAVAESFVAAEIDFSPVGPAAARMAITDFPISRYVHRSCPPLD